jgi:hypothetical protein
MTKRLDEKYFEDKEFKSISSAGLRDFVRTNPSAERLAWEAAEKINKHSVIESDFKSMSDVQLIDCMRKKIYQRHLMLREELISRGEAILPMILEKFVISLNDAFLDHTFIFITSLNCDCEAYLLERLDDIKSAYTQSVVCPILGIIGSEKSTEVLDSKYNTLKKEYPTKNYEQGPLYGMWTLGERLGHHNIAYDILD